MRHTPYAVRRTDVLPYAVCRTPYAVRRMPYCRTPYATHCAVRVVWRTGGGGVAAVRRAAVRRMLYANLKIRGIAHILRIGGLRLTILDGNQ